MKLALLGSGEFTAATKTIDDYIVNTYAPRTIAILATAAGQEHDRHKWLDMARRHYAEYDLTTLLVPIFDTVDANNPDLIAPLAQADWIFFSGGDPGYLLAVLSGSRLWQAVLDRLSAGALVSGSSAGAMVLGNLVLCNPTRALFSSRTANWRPGLNLIDHTVFPHFDRMQKLKPVLKAIVKHSPPLVQSTWVGIDENTALIIDEGRTSIHGSGSVTYCGTI